MRASFPTSRHNDLGRLERTKLADGKLREYLFDRDSNRTRDGERHDDGD